jgi:hypothetical protein
MARKNPGVRFGRPPATAASKMPKGGRGAAPSESFSPGIPASGFKRGGSAGYSTMPQHHDDPKLKRGGGKYDPLC